MNKLFKLISVFTIALSMLTIGCGPSKEEQYNSLKQETLKMSEEVYNLYREPSNNHVKRSHDGIKRPYEEARKILIKEFKEANNKAIEKMPTIEKNIIKMKELAKDNVNLSNDLNKTIKEIKDNTYNKIKTHKELLERNGKLPDDWKTIEPKF